MPTALPLAFRGPNAPLQPSERRSVAYINRDLAAVAAFTVIELALLVGLAALLPLSINVAALISTTG